MLTLCISLVLVTGRARGHAVAELSCVPPYSQVRAIPTLYVLGAIDRVNTAILQSRPSLDELSSLVEVHTLLYSSLKGYTHPYSAM